MEVKTPGAGAADRIKQTLARSVVPFPLWCATGNATALQRFEACGISEALVTTHQFVNGVWVKTGELGVDVYNFSYTAPDLGTWAHQVGVASFAGYGAALGAERVKLSV